MNKIIVGDAANPWRIKDDSVHLIVTSPPYNVGKPYEHDRTLDEYREFLRCVWREALRVLVDGGRLCVNIAGTGRKPCVPLQAYVAIDIIQCGFHHVGDIVWNKGATAASTAWGSWLSPCNPSLRAEQEYILCFCKGAFGRSDTGEATITKQDFMDATRSVWTFSVEKNPFQAHPAPFPVELPRRLIELYTFKGDVVLDPFMGSGSTAVAAELAHRSWWGIEQNAEYARKAQWRIAREGKQQCLFGWPKTNRRNT